MERKKLVFLSILIMVIYFAGIVFPYHNILLIILIVIYTFFTINAIKDRSIALPNIIIASIVLQNTFLGIGCRVFGAIPGNVALFSQIPTLFTVIPAVIIIVFECIIEKQILPRKHLLFFFYVCIILIYCFIGERVSLRIYAYNIRNLTIFYFAHIAGEYCIDSEQDADSISNSIIVWCIISSIIGLIGMITGGQLFVDMGAQEVGMIRKGSDTIKLYPDGLTANFHGDFFGYQLTRIGGLFLEPVNFSYFLGLGVVLCILKCKRPTDYLVSLFLFICQILTFGKGGLLITSLCLSCCFLSRFLIKHYDIESKKSFISVVSFMIVSIAVLGVVYGKLYSYNFHFKSIARTFMVLIKNPLGFGVGSAGNVSNSLKGLSNYAIGSETGLLNFWYQIGIIGLLMFITIILGMARRALIGFCQNPTNIRFVFSILPVCLLLVFIYQENTFTTQVICPYMLLLGFYSNTDTVCKQIPIKDENINPEVAIQSEDGDKIYLNTRK